MQKIRSKYREKTTDQISAKINKKYIAKKGINLTWKLNKANEKKIAKPASREKDEVNSPKYTLERLRDKLSIMLSIA